MSEGSSTLPRKIRILRFLIKEKRIFRFHLQMFLLISGIMLKLDWVLMLTTMDLEFGGL